jgi:transcriptional regulator GlxA family with amidase domain
MLEVFSLTKYTLKLYSMGMETAVLLFDDVNALDVVGPCELLSKIPDMVMKYVAKEPGPKKTNVQLKLTADYALSDISKPNIIVIPGGQGIKSIIGDKEIINWITNCHKITKWTVSVCTGALLLGAAGILKGIKATTHWISLSSLENFGAKPQKQRVVTDGKVITCAGVSAGIDMALTLTGLIAGETTAQAIQLAIEYDPAPPFNSGSPDKAPKAIVELILRKAQESNLK